MAENPLYSIEDEPIKYVKGDDDLWHWFDTCPKYPVENLKTQYESHELIPSQNLCKHCLLIELKKSLESVSI